MHWVGFKAGVSVVYGWHASSGRPVVPAHSSTKIYVVFLLYISTFGENINQLQHQ